MSDPERTKEWERLKAENPRLEVEDAYHRGWSSGYAYAAAQTAALRAALREHGLHRRGCAASPDPTTWREADSELCNCWLGRALLADPEGQRSRRP